jgi:photosystem II stability/assembly factor-like uncharacterized protein
MRRPAATLLSGLFLVLSVSHASRCARGADGGPQGRPAAEAGAGSPSRQSPATPSRWTYLGLGSRHVTKLRLHGDLLYACTDDGLYRRELAAADTLWAPLGLAGRRVQAVWAASPESLLAGIRLPAADSVSLYRSNDGGASWQPYQNGFGAGRYPEVQDLAGLPPPARGLIGVAATIEKSDDAGAHWRQVADGCVFNFVRANPAAPGHAWAGGETCIFAPVIFRSTDSGDSWREMHLEAGGDNACDAVAFHPDDPARVYVGMEGRVMRTLDGGDKWEEVTSPDPGLYLYGIAVRLRPPLRLYAAGANAPPDPRGVVLYASDDGGQSWISVAQPAALRYGVFDLLFVEHTGEDWLLVATDRGAYRYVDAPTAVAPFTWSRAKQLFRAGARDSTHGDP